MESQEQSFGFYICYFIVSAIGIMLTSKIISGFKISGFFSAFVAALFIAFANNFIWPILIFLTLPINILTLGLFTFVVNGAILKICAAFLPGFEIDTWLAAIFGSIVLSVINVVLHFIFV